MNTEITLRKPESKDGQLVHELIRHCPPLDINSLYCNLLQCTHFSDSSVAAFIDENIVGFISGYFVPGHFDTLFIWQVAVSEEVRGRGIGLRMLNHILNRPQCDDVNFVETTITESNNASWGLFKKLASQFDVPLNHKVMFDKETHFNGEHDTEMLVSIGPIYR